jgi:uncharacterized protein (UPF0548 family)
MPRRLSRLHRLRTAAGWPLGVSLTSWRYLWRTTPMRRTEEPGALPQDSPPPLPDGIDRDELQGAEDGVGPLFHRRYRVRIAGSELTAQELMERFGSDLNAVAPTELARFHKIRGAPDRAACDDEHVVRMPGPWDGPVRTVAVTPTSLRLATLDGHLEAGQIEFRAERDGALTFTIESWARSATRMTNLLYHRLRMSKEVQLHMWASLLERVVRLAGGQRLGLLEIRTRRVEDAGGRRSRREQRARRALAALHDRAPNYDLGAHPPRTPGKGWHVDDYRQALPGEAPGPPQPDGPWEVAQRLMRDYAFADPRIVRALYRRDGPLAGRDMLLEARFLALRFRFGVRVAGVIDERRTVAGRAVQAWGWSYRTLQGHLEMGQMDYELWKWLDDGAVEFRIHVVSRAARISNPLLRLGFRIFGRGQQRRFARHACTRMAQLVTAELEGGGREAAGGPRRTGGVAGVAALRR